MKTIEQRATEYACDDGVMPDSPECESCFNIYGKCTRDAYIASANAEHKELTRWHDPKEVLPEDGKDVLCMTDRRFHTYEVLRHNKHGWWMRVHIPEGGWCACDCNVISWREIIE